MLQDKGNLRWYYCIYSTPKNIQNVPLKYFKRILIEFKTLHNLTQLHVMKETVYTFQSAVFFVPFEHFNLKKNHILKPPKLYFRTRGRIISSFPSAPSLSSGNIATVKASTNGIKDMIVLWRLMWICTVCQSKTKYRQCASHWKKIWAVSQVFLNIQLKICSFRIKLMQPFRAFAVK